MAIEVIKPGLATSVQDAGRPGYYHLGIPLSGALDQEGGGQGGGEVGRQRQRLAERGGHRLVVDG